MPIRKPLRYDDEYNEYVKDFYRKIEDYDWNYVVSNRVGLEHHLHRSRERHIRELQQSYGFGDRYLDVGCGSGLILQHLPAGSIGIDINPRHVARARQYVPAATVRLGDAENLEFEDNSFTTVVCTETIEHLVHPEKALQEIRRVLQPGGILIGSTPRRSLFWKFRFLSSTHFHNEPFHNEYRWREIREVLQPFQVMYLKPRILRSTFFFVARNAKGD